MARVRMVTSQRVRDEINIPDVIKDKKFTASMDNGQDETQRIVEDLDALVIDYGHLQDDDNFTEDGGATHRLTYTHITYLAAGYDDAAAGTYTTLISNINIAIQANGRAALTDREKLRLRDAGRDFRKAETYLALAFYVLSGGLRATNEGGFVQDIAFGTGRTRLLNLQDLRKLSGQFRSRAYNQIYDWLRDPDAEEYSGKDSITYTGDAASKENMERYPDKVHTPDFGMMAVPKKSKRSSNPRERYTGGGS